jgi:hypothetical protein
MKGCDVDDDRPKRLIDFIRDRSGWLADRCPSGDAGEGNVHRLQ